VTLGYTHIVCSDHNEAPCIKSMGKNLTFSKNQKFACQKKFFCVTQVAILQEIFAIDNEILIGCIRYKNAFKIIIRPYIYI
jgi:hypothetical protein